MGDVIRLGNRLSRRAPVRAAGVAPTDLCTLFAAVAKEADAVAEACDAMIEAVSDGHAVTEAQLDMLKAATERLGDACAGLRQILEEV